MADVLSQSEIESLLGEMVTAAPPEERQPSPLVDLGDEPLAQLGQDRVLRTGENKLILPLSRRRHAALTGRDLSLAYEPYDFRCGDKLSKEHIRTLQVIHENFARLFTSSISAYLRSTIQIDLISIEQVPYEEYIRSVSDSLVNVLNVAPVSGQAMLELDLRMLFAILDRLLGGIGEGHIKPGKDLTDVEKVLAKGVVRRALTELAAAWHDVVPLEFTVASVETSAQFIQIVPPNDTVVLMLFDIMLGDQQGAMSLSIPYMMLKPIAARLDATHWFASTKRTSHTLAPRMAERLREETLVPCIARIGTSGISVDTLAHLEVGQILPLNVAGGNRSEHSGGVRSLACVDLLIGKSPKFRGHIGLRGGKRLAVQIDEVLKRPPTLEIHRELPS
jgi:flagellar motor switch protein FliM